MLSHIIPLMLGSIPAWAGETSCNDVPRPAPPVYPRVGGGNAMCAKPADRCRGLSPRGRGKLYPSEQGGPHRRSIPAWAGETGMSSALDRQREVYPRVGGGNSVRKALSGGSAGLSPRGRGKRVALWSLLASLRSIPAWAGETPAIIWRICIAEVYPRVGGGNGRAPMPTIAELGLSPRGRGKR